MHWKNVYSFSFLKYFKDLTMKNKRNTFCFKICSAENSYKFIQLFVRKQIKYILRLLAKCIIVYHGHKVNGEKILSFSQFNCLYSLLIYSKLIKERNPISLKIRFSFLASNYFLQTFRATH